MNLVGEAKKDQNQMQILSKATYQPCYEDNISCLNDILFLYSYKLIKKGRQLQKQNEYLTLSDLSECPKPLQPKVQFDISEKIFQEEDKKKQREGDFYKKLDRKLFTKTMLRVLNNLHYKTMIQVIIGNIMQFSGPLCLKYILEYLQDPTAESKKAYIAASIILTSYVIRFLVLSQGMDNVNRYNITTLNGFNSLLLLKVQRLAQATKKYIEAGKIMNYATVDQNTLMGMTLLSSQLYSAPAMIIISIVLICVEIGWWGLLTPVGIILTMFIQGFSGRKSKALRGQTMYWKDKRSKSIFEYFTGIKIIKYYAWEDMVEKNIRSIREQESTKILGFNKIRTNIDAISNSSPLLISVIVIICYIADGNDMLPSQAYTVISYFNLLIQPMKMMMFSVLVVIQFMTTLQRMNHFMDSQDQAKDTVIQNEQLPKGTIEIINGNFAWESIESFEHNLISQQQDLVNRRIKGQQLQIELEKLKKQEQEMRAKDLTILKNVNFKAEKGQLIGVIGTVGAGKTTFLHALIGEIERLSGTVQRNGTISYVSQQSWMQNVSLKDNILFGNPYDEQKYRKIIKICELTADLLSLPGGDQTEIGERGLNLSGGQKQRLAIARAIYQESDIYIIDDCLSALDAHVGKNIFYNVLKQHLKDKTVIFVTHALQYMPEMSKIAVMQQGQIVEFDTYQNLLKNKNSAYNQISVQIKKEIIDEDENEEDEDIHYQHNENQSFMNQSQFDDIDEKESHEHRKKKQHLKKQSIEIVLEKKISKKQSVQIEEIDIIEEQKKKQQGAMIQSEERAVGAVAFQVYKNYMFSGGGCTFFMVCLTLIMAQLVKTFNDWWIGKWTSDSYGLTRDQYILIYGISGVLVVITYVYRGILFCQFAIKCADAYQYNIIHSLLHTPMSWFDVTPTGRVISRCTKDQDDIDSLLPFSLQSSIVYVLQFIGSLILVIVVLPIFAVFAIAVLITMFYAVKQYMLCIREIKRIESNVRSPVISTIQESINGLTIIRSFGKIDFYKEKYLENQHQLAVALINQNYAQRWVTQITELGIAVLTCAACYLAVLSKELSYMDDSQSVGLALSQVFSVTTILTFTLKMIADAEAQMNSLVRILQYVENNPQEAKWHEPKPKQNWPEQGQIEAKSITYKYRPELPEVIKQINFEIKPKEKVGIVGRTGSGKSTLTLGLLRIIELAKDSKGNLGQILIDGQNIADIGLHILREKCTIIPQDPVLFTGNLRSNIDPFQKYTNKECVDALKAVHIWDQLGQIYNRSIVFQQKKKTDKQMQSSQQSQLTKDQEQKNKEEFKPAFVDEEEKLLNTPVDDGGENFSLGQRQLICMARALIRKPKVLLMDEATASIDEKTDQMIQKMIKHLFTETTVVTIAHRINTIIQYDKLIILEQGNVVEIDTPYNLITQNTGIFAQLVNEGGEEFRQKMLYLAQNKNIDLDQV